MLLESQTPTFFRRDEPFWAAVGAAVTAVMAIATATLAGFTWRVLGATNREVAAAERQATASADLVREIQSDRDLNWQPYPWLTENVALGDAAGGPDKIDYINIGGGPAFNCAYARYCENVGQSGQIVPPWRASKPQIVIARGGTQGAAEVQPPPIPVFLLHDQAGKIADRRIAIFFQDTLGNPAHAASTTGPSTITFPR